MCGRYASSRNPDELAEEFEVIADHASGQVGVDYNLAPTDTAPVVLTRRPRGEDADGPIRQLRALTWGLIPSWAKDRRGGARLINARSEEVFVKPTFRRAAAARRCLVPATGWYEWARFQHHLDAKGKPVRQPFFMRRQDGTSMALAGLYEFWRDPAVADKEDPAAWVTSFTILTRAAEEGLDRIHDRMPLVLEREVWASWLDPDATERADVEDLIAQSNKVPPGRFRFNPVSTAVNSVSNDGPQLMDPIQLDLFDE